MSDGNERKKERKVAKRRRQLPTVPPTSVGANTDGRKKSIEERPRTKVEELKRLPKRVLQQLQDVENSFFMPGMVEDIAGSEIATPGDKISTITLKSGKKVQITMKDGSFRRITGLREHVDASGSFIIRRVEIKKEPGKSLGFYIRLGDGWFRKDGVFVSRLNLGSIVDVNRLLSVGDEIVRINDVDVTSMGLDDVVLIMQYVQKMVLTIKVLRGVADTLHNLKLRRRRELPRTPSHLESKKYHSSAAESVKAQVDLHFYDDVDYSTRPTTKSKGASASSQFSLGGSSLSPAKITKEIKPYSKVQILQLMDSQKPSGSSQEDDDDINPYAQVSSELKAELATKKELESKVSSSGGPVLVGDLISPYSQIKRLPPDTGSWNTLASPITLNGSTAGKVGEDKINPYAEVSKELKAKFRVENRNQSEAGDSKEKTEGPGSETVDSPTSLETPEDGPMKHQRLSVMLEEYTPAQNQMDMEGLVDIIRTAQFGPRSPVVRKSFIFEEPEAEDSILELAHVYAQIDRNRNNSSSENTSDQEIFEHRGSNAQPPSPPKSPVPLDSDDLETLPQILPVEDQSDVGDGNSVEEVITFSPTGYSENPLTSDEIENTMLHQSEAMDLALTEALAELDENDIIPPPLPPPYVPDESPPEFSDCEDDREEWKSETAEYQVGVLTLNRHDQEGDQHTEEWFQNETVPELSEYPGDVCEEKQPIGRLASSNPVARRSNKDGDVKATSMEITAISPFPMESPTYVSDQDKEGEVVDSEQRESNASGNEEEVLDEAVGEVLKEAGGGHLRRQRLEAEHPGDNGDLEDQSHTANTSVDFGPPPSLPPDPPELPPPDYPPPELPSSELQNSHPDHLTPELPPSEPDKFPPESPLLELLPSESEYPLPENPLADFPPPEIPPPVLPPPHSPPRALSEAQPPPSPPTQLPEHFPPPPIPPTGPPEDDNNGDSDDEKKSYNSDISSRSSSYVRLPILKIQDIGTSSPSDKRFSGMVAVVINRLNTSSKRSSTFWSTNAMQKMIFTLSIDNCTKIITTLPLNLHQKQAEPEHPDEYYVILLQNFHVKFSLHSICLPNISKCTKLVDIFPSQQESSRSILISFEHYGELQLSLFYNPMASTVSRLNPQGTTPQAKFSDYVLLNSSGYPLILERSVHVVEKFGLKTAHLYDRCAPKVNKQRALASCMGDLDNQSMKSAVIKCSVHAFTGIIVDFFCELPEPFFTNILGSDLTQVASVSRDPRVLDEFLEKLPEEETKTLKLLISHFKTLCQHGNKNGVSVKLLSRLFGPLLLIPSLSPNSNSTQPMLDFAEDYFSQSRVIELLLSRDT